MNRSLVSIHSAQHNDHEWYCCRCGCTHSYVTSHLIKPAIVVADCTRCGTTNLVPIALPGNVLTPDEKVEARATHVAERRASRPNGAVPMVIRRAFSAVLDA